MNVFSFLKNKNFLKFFSLVVCLSFLLTGCASYNASALTNLSPDLIMNSSSKSSDLGIAAKAFSKADCKRYLDRDVMSKGYQPVQLFIQNNTEKSFSFALNRISLPHAGPEEVAEKVHTSTAGRAAGYGAGSLVFWPLLVPAVVESIKSSQANEALDNDFFTKSAKDQVLQPYSYINTLIFVPSSGYTNSFTVSLIDLETNKPVILSASAT
ncbi:MAG: hypothetical protein K1000chlam3_01477 [Chlamydiae bacterium]|nr:hypothetical protein [Chlamydiota bacterium]